MDADDHNILQQFIATRSHPAFAELVRRYANLVYASALRQMKSSADAEDVTQAAFILLAQNAHRIRSGEAIGGWLLTTTRYVALNALRAEGRRRDHERKAAEMIERKEGETLPESNELASAVLDAAIVELHPADRDAITMRYLQGMSVPEVAANMGISTFAAQKRLGRALEKLRVRFGERGVRTTSDALSATLFACLPTSVPTLLVQRITNTALLHTSSVSSASSLGALKSAALLLAASKTKFAVFAMFVSLMLIVGAGVVVHQQPALISAGMSTPATAGEWREVFNAVYALEPNEYVRRINPPPSERQIYYASDVARTDNERSHPPEKIIFQWTEGAAHGWSFGIETNVASLLEKVTGLWPQELEIPRQMLSMPTKGDWLFDPTASSQQRASAFTKTLPEVFGTEMALQPSQIERDVIVARGVYSFVPLEGQAQRPSLDTIYAFRGERPEAASSSIAAPRGRALQWLGAMISRPIIIEADLSTELARPSAVALVISKSADFLTTAQPPENVAVDDILANVTKQTALKFSRERRVITVWRLTNVRQDHDRGT